MTRAASFQQTISPPKHAGEYHSYWSQYKHPISLKESASVPSVALSNTDMAVCSGSKVQIYSISPLALKKSISFSSKHKRLSLISDHDTLQFTKAAFRQDDRILALGDMFGGMQLYDTASYGALRRTRLHDSAIRDISFNPFDHVELVTSSDDMTIKHHRLDRIGNDDASPINIFTGHYDHVRCVAFHPSMHGTVISGGYDHCINVWDTRTCSPQLSMDHGAPVESIVAFGTMLISSGGSDICIWDLLNGGKLIDRWTMFQKTVTCISTLETSSKDISILAGGLDRYIKIFSITPSLTPKIQHEISLSDPILSLDVSPTCLVAGMLNGLVSIRSRNETSTIPNDVVSSTKSNRPILKEYDQYFKGFQYRKALDAALENGEIKVVSAVLESLYERSDGLDRALDRQNDPDSLIKLFSLIEKYIADPKYNRILFVTLNNIISSKSFLYLSSIFKSQLSRIQDSMMHELSTQKEAIKLIGSLECIMSCKHNK